LQAAFLAARLAAFSGFGSILLEIDALLAI
jgi:hypothetical protein